MQGNSRKINNRGGGKIIGNFASQKTGKMIRWESQLERDYIYHLELDPNVIDYVSQPEAIEYKNIDGKIAKYTPDFWVKRQNCEELVEIKPKEKTMETDFMEKIKSIDIAIKSAGYKYLIITEEDIYINPKFTNLKLLYRYSRFSPNEFKKEICVSYFRKKESAILRDILNDLSKQNITIDIIFQLLGRGILSIDLNKKLDLDTCIYMTS